MRVYISGQIIGDPDYNNRFCKAEEMLKDKGYEVVNPVKIGQCLPEIDREEYLKIDLTILSVCDAIFMLDGWENSRGANREYGYAVGKGLIVIE